MTRRAFVTGLDGFTGGYMATALRGAGYAVHGLSRDGSAVTGATTYASDLLNLEQLRSILAAAAPDVIVHLAAISSVTYGDVQAIYDVNVVGTRNLLEAALDLTQKPQAVLVASSANIYGNRTEGVIGEDSLPDPVNDYAISKLAMEYVARLYGDRLPIIVTRPFNYTGKGQSDNFLIPKIIHHFQRRASAIELGNLNVSRDFSDVRTVVAAYVRLLEQSAAIGTVVNICSGEAYSLADIIEMASEITGHCLDVRVNPNFVRSKEVTMLRGNPDRLNTLIGQQKRLPLIETLRWMLEE